MDLSKRTPLFILLLPFVFVLSACGESDSVDDSPPLDENLRSRSLYISDGSLPEGDTSSMKMTFTVSLDYPAIGDVSVDYATRDGSANAGVDYQTNNGTVTIPDGETSSSFSVVIYGDTTLEVNETFFVDISNLSGDAYWSRRGDGLTATGTIITDDASTPRLLNDTGSRFSGNELSGNNAGCTGPAAGEQDCSSGRDQNFATNSDTDGHAGFSFTKLDAAGNSLADSATTWACVRDDVTNLTWEVKQTSGAHNTASKYYWKTPGSSGDGVTDTSINCSDPDAAYCNSSAFVLRVNAEVYCGISDWRLPRTNELLNITNLNTSNPAVDTLFLPNTQSDKYMTSYVRTLYSVLVTDVVNFTLGSATNQSVSQRYYIRLVSDSSPAPAAASGPPL